MRKLAVIIAVAIPMCCLLSLAIYYLPPVHSRLAWRVDELQIWAKSQLSPPEQVEFAPQGQAVAAEEVRLPAPAATPTATPAPSPTPTIPEATPLPSATPTLVPTALPEALNLKGVRYMDQHGLWNYCAPSNLAMALSYWGWKGDRLDTGKVLKPNQYDKNVMPYEMANYVRENTALQVIVRVGGDFTLLKTFLSNGFPVLVEKGAYIKDFTGVLSWMGHYQVVTGYDDARSVFIAQDSYFEPDFEVAYDNFLRGWRSFNYTYLVIYPPERENEVLAILGPQLDETANYQHAAQKASDEIYALTGVDQFFAWFNRGTNLKKLQDYGGAALAYDEAFKIYNSLPEDRSIRPYRMLWYQTGPFFAYYFTQRHYDVITLANASLSAVLDNRPALEESFFWRARAKAALGDTAGAIEDFRESLKWHKDFPPTVEQLLILGVEP